MWYIDWHKSIDSLILPGYMPAHFSTFSCVSCAKSFVAELAPPYTQSVWRFKRERVRVAGLAACCNYFSKKKKNDDILIWSLNNKFLTLSLHKKLIQGIKLGFFSKKKKKKKRVSN